MSQLDLPIGIIKFLDENKAILNRFKDLTITEQRESIRKMNSKSNKNQNNQSEEWKVEWDQRSIPIRIYRPQDEDNVPIFIYFHGGGWVLGDIETRDDFCHRVSVTAECIVIAVDYKLSPGYTYPEALKDGVAVVEWLLADEFRLWDLRRIVLAGDGAGANIAAGITYTFNQTKSSIKIFHQVLICPITDFRSFETKSYKKFESGYFLEKWMMETYKYCYLTDKEEANHPLVSPLLISEFQHLPPSTVITAEYDILHDEGKVYALKLLENEVPVDYHDFDRMIHGFLALGDYDPEVENSIIKLLVIIKSNIN